MSLLHLFRSPGYSTSQTQQLLRQAREALSSPLEGLHTEACYNIQSAGELNPQELETLTWLLSETFHLEGFGNSTFLGRWWKRPGNAGRRGGRDVD